MRLLAHITRLSLVAPAYAALCPLLGPVFPPPKSLSSSISFQSALETLRSTFDTALSSGNGTLNTKDTYSVQIYSTSDNGSPLFDFHRRGANLSKDVKLDGDAIYRIASTSKLVATYLLLLQAGDDIWAEKVTKYLPELSGKQHWDDITVGALAGYISGITSEVYDNSILPGGDIGVAFPEAFPPLAKNESRGCGYGTNSCTREILLDSTLAREPNFLPNTSPVYSNAAFAILGLIIEATTGASFAESLRTLLIKPLSLTGTSTSAPNSSTRSVIIADTPFPWWEADMSDAPSAAMGGMYSSANDLSAVGRAILSSSLLPANTTRAWLQPTAFTSSLTGAVGRGWEIYRHVLSAPENRVVDIYSKAGNFGSYGSNFFLIPAYNIGVTVLQAGQRGTTGATSNLITAHIVPALEEAAREEANAAFAGTYTIPGQNSTITLTTTPGLAGLTLTTWIRNATDITALPLFAGPTPGPVRFQMYPTNAHGAYALSGEDTETQSWRVKYVDWQGDGPFDACGSWATVDRPTYGLWGIDEFVFTLEKGRARSVRPTAWKEDFVRA